MFERFDVRAKGFHFRGLKIRFHGWKIGKGSFMRCVTALPCRTLRYEGLSRLEVQPRDSIQHHNLESLRGIVAVVVKQIVVQLRKLA